MMTSSVVPSICLTLSRTATATFDLSLRFELMSGHPARTASAARRSSEAGSSSRPGSRLGIGRRPEAPVVSASETWSVGSPLRLLLLSLMGVTTHPYVPVSDAPYPVINAQPTFFATFRNLTLGDYFLFLSMTTLGAGYGFAAGARALFCACAQARLDACCIRIFFRAAL